MTKIVGVVMAALLLLGACGGEERYGSEDLRVEGEDAGRLGAIERETPPPAKAVPKAPAATATPAPKTGPSPTPVLPTLTVKITSQGFQPFSFRVFKGSKIRVENHDSQARTFTADDGSFDSGEIAPGKSWVHELTAKGTFNFHDETRPFVVGQMEVVDP